MALVLEIITSTNFDFWTLQCILEMFGSQSLESNCTNSIIPIILMQPNLYLYLCRNTRFKQNNAKDMVKEIAYRYLFSHSLSTRIVRSLCFYFQHYSKHHQYISMTLWLIQNHSSNHPLSIITYPMQGRRGWEQFITGLTHRDKQSFTPMGNL